MKAAVLSSGFAWFQNGICSKCGRTSVRRDASEWKSAFIVEEVCLGCNALVTSCACKDTFRSSPGPS